MIKNIRRIATAALLASALSTPFTAAAEAEAPTIELGGIQPIGPDYDKPWMKPIRTKLPWWLPVLPPVNTHPELDRKHEPICDGATIYARFTDAESPTADLTVTVSYTNTKNQPTSIDMTMRPRVEDHVVTIPDLQVPDNPYDNMLSIFAYDPSGSYFAVWLNRDCGVTFSEAQVL